MADIEIRAQAGMSQPINPFAQFAGVFEKEARLAFYTDVDTECIRAIEEWADGLGELPRGFIGGHAAQAAAAGDADVGRADILRKLQGFDDHRGAVGAMDGIGADEAGLEVRLWRGILPVANRTIAIDVADGKSRLFQ